MTPTERALLQIVVMLTQRRAATRRPHHAPAESLGPIETWWQSRLAQGALTSAGDGWGVVTSDALFSDYVAHARSLGMGRDTSRWRSAFAIRLRVLAPGVQRERPRLNGLRVYMLRFPPLDECRAAFEAATRHKCNWQAAHGGQTGDGNLVSLTDLACLRGVSRQAIWKRVLKYEAAGLLHVHRRGRNVALINPDEFDQAAVLRTDPAGDPQSRLARLRVGTRQNARAKYRTDRILADALRDLVPTLRDFVPPETLRDLGL